MGLVATTHDFEAHYTDRLIGPLPAAPRRSTRSARRSHRAASMTGSVLLLQGTEDPVVPPAQAERMRDALAAAGTPLRPAVLRGRGPRLPPGRHPDRMPRGRTGVLPLGASASRISRGFPPASPPVCEAFATPCRRLPRRRRHPDLDRPPAPTLARGVGTESGAISPEAGDALLYVGSAALRAPHHLHVDQRALPGVGPHGAARRSSSARWPRPCSPGRCAAPAGARPGTR